MNQCYVFDTLLSHGASQVSFQYTKCTKRSFRWTRCSRYHCKDEHHCGKFWQQTNPPQLTINSSNFSHLFSCRTQVTAQKKIFFISEENIFFQKPLPGPSAPIFVIAKNWTAQILGAADPPGSYAYVNANRSCVSIRIAKFLSMTGDVEDLVIGWRSSYAVGSMHIGGIKFGRRALELCTLHVLFICHHHHP